MFSESKARGQGCSQVLWAAVHGEAAHPGMGATQGVGGTQRGVQTLPRVPLHGPSHAMAAQHHLAEEQPSPWISPCIAWTLAARVSSKWERLWVQDWVF